MAQRLRTQTEKAYIKRSPYLILLIIYFLMKDCFLALHINPRFILLDITTCRRRIILLDIATCPNYHVDALQQEIVADCQLGELAIKSKGGRLWSHHFMFGFWLHHHVEKNLLGKIQVSCKLLVFDPMFKTSKMHERKIVIVHAFLDKKPSARTVNDVQEIDTS